MLNGYSFAILIASDRAASGERPDATGERLKSLVQKNGGQCPEVTIVPDDPQALRQQILAWVHRRDVDAILTSGGTGIGPKDFTVDVTRELIEKELPGFGEEMRRRSLDKTPFAILSRATAGTLNHTFILNLPGSPKGAQDCLKCVLKALAHGLDVLKSQVTDCQP